VRIIADELTDKGYHVFKERIPNDMCDELMRFSLENQLIPRVANSPHMFYDRANPIATVYDTPNQSAIFGSLAFQRLISDPSLLAVVEAYLGPHFYLQNASMRWSNARKKNVSLSDAAQLYHADIDTINWVKIFVYLTDVNVDTGPFCFISGSHRNKPKPVRRDGRLRDEELSAVYKPSDFIEVVGKRGTTIVADTIGFHKGKPLAQDDRLMMYLTFGTSFFGFGMPAKIEATDHISPEFLQKVNELSPLYKGYFH